MARGTILTTVLGAIRQQADGTYSVIIKGKEPKTFPTEEAAEKWRASKAPKRYRAIIAAEVDGVKKQVWKTFEKQDDAETYLDHASIDVREDRYQPPSEITFEKYVADWCAINFAELELSTLTVYHSHLDRHLIPAFGKTVTGTPRPIAAIKTTEIKKFRSSLLESGTSKSAVKNIMNLLGRIFDEAVADKKLTESPMPKQRQKKKSKKETANDNHERGVALTPDEARRLFEQCEADSETGREADNDLELVNMLGLLGGLRRSEIFGLRFQDIDWDRNLLNVRNCVFWRWGKHQTVPEGEAAWILTEPKTKGSKRSIDLSPKLKAKLHERYMRVVHKRGFVLQNGTGPINGHNFFERRFKPAVERARKQAEQEKARVKDLTLREELEKTIEKFTNLRLHDLRHSYGSWLVSQGQDIVYVSKQMGHAKPSITYDIYSHLIRERRPEAAARLDTMLYQIPVAETEVAASMMVN